MNEVFRNRGRDVTNTVKALSYLMLCDVINCGCDAFYRVNDVIYIMGVMSYIQRV